jgi:chemotaxis methyl-accepting protein methylase
VDAFADRLEAALAEALRRLAASGSAKSDLAAYVFGGTDTARWQIDRLQKALAGSGLTVRLLDDRLGSAYRTVRYRPKARTLEVAHVQENAAHWSPAASALGIADGVRIFSQNAVTGKVANATRFFREQKTFRALRERIVPDFLQRGGRTFRVWSAACSSGEEAYSYAMYLMRLRERAGASFKIEIFGSDVNESLLQRAREGVYDVPTKDVQEYGAYFRRYGSLEGLRFTVGEEIRTCTRFGIFDIRKQPRRHRFHFIVCANVFQYYNDEARMHFLQNFAAACERPGYVYVNNARRETAEALGLQTVPPYGIIRVG